MVPNYGHWLTDFRTVFVFALGPFLPMFVIFFDFNGNFNGKMAKNHFLAIKSSRSVPFWPYLAIYGHLAFGPWPTNNGKWGIPEKSYKNVAQQ